MDRADSLWYHMPLATRFAHGAHFGSIDYFDPIFFASFYPANSEVVHAVPMLAFDRDILSPLLNLGWLGLGLTAAYSIGRPYGLGPQSLIGGAIALGAQNLVEFQAGEALNDIVGVSLILAAVAMLVNAAAARAAVGGPRPTCWPLGIAGLAAGLAAGTKLSFLAPVVALFVGLVVIAPSGSRMSHRRSGSGSRRCSPAATGSCATRSRSATRSRTRRSGRSGCRCRSGRSSCAPAFSVSHYATDFGVWSDWFFPGLDDSFGFLWPLVLIALRRRRRLRAVARARPAAAGARARSCCSPRSPTWSPR